MLSESSNLRVLGRDACAEHALQPNTASVTLKSLVDQSANQAVDISSSFSVRECLVGSRLVETVEIRYFSLPMLVMKKSATG